MDCTERSSGDDEVPELSRDTLAALQDFYSERDAQQKGFEELKSATKSNSQPKLSMDMFTEDWNASQFWVRRSSGLSDLSMLEYILTHFTCQYNDDTALTLAKEVLSEATASTCIAVVSAPSAFIQIKNLLASEADTDEAKRPQLCLLEFDERFAVLKGFPRSYNQTSSSIEITTPFLSTFLDIPNTSNVPSQTSTLVLTPDTSTSTTSNIPSTLSLNPLGQIGQVPAFANDPGASTIANDASATLFSRSYTLGTGAAGVSTATPTTAVQQSVSTSGLITNTIVIGSSNPQSSSIIETLNTNPVSFSIQTAISSTLSTLTSAMVSAMPTTTAIILTPSSATATPRGSASGFSSSTVSLLSTIIPKSSNTVAQPSQAATATQMIGISVTAAATTIPSASLSAVATTVVASSTDPTVATNTAAPISQSSNLVMALAYNAIFDTLTADSNCSAADSSSAVACISGSFAQCGSDDKYTLATCPQGQRCFALPLSGDESGVSVQCDSSEDGASKLGLAAPEATSVVFATAIPSTAVMSPLTFSTSLTTLIPQPTTSAQSAMTSLTTFPLNANSTVIVSTAPIAAQSPTADLTTLASNTVPTMITPQVVTRTSNSISSSIVADLFSTIVTTTTPDIFGSLTTVPVQPLYTTSTSTTPKVTSVSTAAESSPLDSRLPSISTDVPLLTMITSMPTSSQVSLVPVQAPTSTSSSTVLNPSSTSTALIIITVTSPKVTQATTLQTLISPIAAQSSSNPIVPTPAFTIIPVKNNATPTVTETITETVTVSATVTVRGQSL
ncbi:hypothetical protein MMC11_002490 [Xylographa trunciseda]|nr:hypothetical protein [Xylographa trunciseda]